MSTNEKMGSKCESAYRPENTGPNGSFQKLMRNRWISSVITGKTGENIGRFLTVIV
jgi:hypothetical protein